MTPSLQQIEAWCVRLGGAEFVPIGWNCNTAHYLNTAEGRRAAYPFDWIFSSPGIVADALSRRFDDFIAPDKVYPVDQHNAAGHQRYHARMFNHGNPHANEETRAAYFRRIDRFLNLFDSAKPICMIATILPETDKRPAWRDGFVRDFALPDAGALESEYSALRAFSARRPGPTFFVLLRQWTGQPTRSVTVTSADTTTLLVDLAMTGVNDGVQFLDEADDACCRLIYSALCLRPSVADVGGR